MNALAFDTLRAARTLESRGLAREQAEAIAEQIAEGRVIDLSELATKADLDPLATKAEMAAFKADTKAEFALIKADIAVMKAEIAALRAEMATKTDLELLKREMTIRLGTMMVVMFGLILAAFRYLPPPH